MVASEVLLEIAEKLRHSQKLTALDLLKLYRVAQGLATASGYEGIKDAKIFFDAAKELQDQQK